MVSGPGSNEKKNWKSKNLLEYPFKYDPENSHDSPRYDTYCGEIDSAQYTRTVSRAVDLYSFFADPDTDPAVLLNA